VHWELPLVLVAVGLQATLTAVTETGLEALPTAKLTVTVSLRRARPLIVDDAAKVIVPVYGVAEALNPEGSALIVTASDPPCPTPEPSDDGDTESQPLSEVATHVSRDPGAPLLLTVVDVVTELPPATPERDTDDGLTFITACGSQSII